jgi:hypothetical protein
MLIPLRGIKVVNQGCKLEWCTGGKLKSKWIQILNPNKIEIKGEILLEFTSPTIEQTWACLLVGNKTEPMRLESITPLLRRG